jgi:signal transduction histidine kinase
MRPRLVRMLAAVLAAICVAAIAWPVYGWQAFVSSLEILAPLGAAAALLADLLVTGHRSIAGLRRQLAMLAILAVAQLAATVVLFAALMFVSNHDAFFMALAAGYAGVSGLAAAWLVTQRALADLDAVRNGLAQVGQGSRDVRIAVRGQDELARLATDVESMAAELASEERARRELVASVSHDLRTPITTLQLIAEGLEDGIFEPERLRDRLHVMSTHVRALGAVIDDLFELSRLEAGEVRWSVQQVRLDQLVHETIDAMRPHAEAGGVAVTAELDQPLAPAQGNPEQLQRVLFNLIQNAIRHTPADGSVVVRAEPAPGPAVEIEVADSGAGIDAELRKHIFEPFVQGPSRVGGENGSAGLGLAIARAIVTAHGGRIWLAGDGPGTRVRFSLPIERPLNGSSRSSVSSPQSV